MLVAPGDFWLWWKSCRCCCPGRRMPRPGFPCVWAMMTARSLCHFGGFLMNISSKPQGSGPRQQEQIWWQQRAPLKSHWRRDLWHAHLFFSRWRAGPDIIVVAQHKLWWLQWRQTGAAMHHTEKCGIFCRFESSAALQTELTGLQERVVWKERHSSQNVGLKLPI